MELKVSDSGMGESYEFAVQRFSKQTQELKKLLDEDEVVSTSDTDCSDEETGSYGSSSDEEYSSDEDSDWDSDLEELAQELTGPTAATPVHRVMSSPALLAMKAELEQDEENVLPGILNIKERMRQCSANHYMQPVDFGTKVLPETVENPFASTKPDDHLKHILEGFSAARFPSNTWHDYFLSLSEEHIEAYTREVEYAIRNEDYATLRKMLSRGQTLQCCNQHGESIVHIACRRGSPQLLKFLVHEAGVSTRIRDDMGRTPLHDACWTHKPNFAIVMELLEVSPELLFIVDHRGFTPLTYAPKETWGMWCEFLQENRQFLRDMVKSLRFDRARYFIKTMVPCLKF
jgi:hypothetical protein